ncbi:RNA polymerase I-specific transcription initiation factor RRN3 isoform X1 [Trichoplusia ni]|uniref:RNA polymerase I-specific transcription initiation factor RRN3 isoform X1 n=1 Tax=Trichoplusia ni TaxID=7111 RepID=A0A7E5V905_TRINI|nr:RNA polymerase I-specific transcription initiation factor RRN3 isoform X1 [Trichoplusia ni]
MAVTPKSVASLMQKTLERQAAVARMRLRFTKNQVEQILVNYAKNKNAGPYLELVKVLRDYPLNEDNFRIVFDDSLSCVVLLGRELTQFVDVVCNIEWLNRSEELVSLYRTFVLNLVTAHTYHCPLVMMRLVTLFKADGENWEYNPPTELLNKWSNIHDIIGHIVAIMPMTSDLLLHIVIEQFPYYKAGCYINRAYIYNLIWMSKYIPSLREQLMTAIINKMILMDVNIVERDKSKSHSETMFEMEMDERDEGAETLDYCMLEVLRWLEDERDPTLNILCNVFERVILPTHGIRHVQFLLLYTISINQQCADRVLNNLWQVAAGLHGLGPGALSTRSTAASHLAGLLARSVRVPNSRLITYLKNMADWCHSYITATREATTSSDNMKAHGAFHSMCHAVFYLVAFKHHLLFMNKENVNFVESLNLPRLVTCALNPLRSCPPAVTRAFSCVTRAHQVVYCQAIIEKNARHTLQSTAVLQYDEWFPYDPYTLPISGKIIWPLCIEYKELKDGDDETQYTSMKRKLETDDDDYLVMASPTQRLASSLSNGISPGFRTSENIFI